MGSAAAGAAARRGASDVLALFEGRAGAAYLGEPVTLREHALQCAALAREAGEERELVAACLLHDVGWLLTAGGVAGEGERDRGYRAELGLDHAERGAAFLAGAFPAGVHEPVRLHVLAKRFLASTEPSLLVRLSDESRRTLALQGGPLDPFETAAFAEVAHSTAAVRLRRYDDAAKVPGRRCPPLDAYLKLLEELAR